jgi:hypothetical protein
MSDPRIRELSLLAKDLPAGQFVAFADYTYLEGQFIAGGEDDEDESRAKRRYNNEGC